MSVLSGQTIRELGLLEPFREKYLDSNGCSCGLSIAGYDITLDHDALFEPHSFTLVAAAERFIMPNNVVGVVHDKSSLARKGIAVQNTVIEPGWRGFLTMEVHEPHCRVLSVLRSKVAPSLKFCSISPTSRSRSHTKASTRIKHAVRKSR